MKGIIVKLENEQKKLEEIIVKLKKQLCQYPDGSLRISKENAQISYYIKNSKEHRGVGNYNGTYIRKSDEAIIRQLAQKSYDKKLLSVAENKYKTINAFLKNYNSGNIMEVYQNMSEERKKLVTPVELPDKEYVAQWEGVCYEGKQFREDAPVILTEKGERVRSKSEKILADKFLMWGIPYRYEYPIYVSGYGTMYPDFTLLNVNTRTEYYWEHLGMMDKGDYSEMAIKKINTYEQAGIMPGKQLILTYETTNTGLNMKNVEIQLKEYFGV